MNKTIWKYRLAVIDFQWIEMPVGAEILSVQRQGEFTCLWTLVDPHARQEKRGIWILGTGNTIEHADNLGRFIGTFQCNDGLLVFHVFA